MDDASEPGASNLAAMHKHRTPLRGVKAIPHPKADDPNYTDINYAYAGRTGHVHEVVEIAGRSLAKIGFDDRKIVYYFLEDLELDERAQRGTFHDADARGDESA